MMKKLTALLLCCVLLAACIPAQAALPELVFDLQGYYWSDPASNVTVSCRNKGVEIVDYAMTDREGILTDREMWEYENQYLAVILQLNDAGELVDAKGNVLACANWDDGTLQMLTTARAGDKSTLLNAVADQESLTGGLFFELEPPPLRTVDFTLHNYEYGKRVEDVYVTEDSDFLDICIVNGMPAYGVFDPESMEQITEGLLETDREYVLGVMVELARNRISRGDTGELILRFQAEITGGEVLEYVPAEDGDYMVIYFLLDPLKKPEEPVAPVVPDVPATGDGAFPAAWLALACFSLLAVAAMRRRVRS